MFNDHSRWCFWSVADGNHSYMVEACIKSARAVGVNADFHIYSDREIEGAKTHIVKNFDKSHYLFKFQFLKNEVSKLDYDWFVFIDADSYFVRNPGNLPQQLCKRDPIFVCLESKCQESSKRQDWWGIPTQKYIKLMRESGVKNTEIYNTNAGFWIVHKKAIPQFYNLAMQFWEKCHRLGFNQVTEEPPLAYVGHLLVAHAPFNTIKNTGKFWASDWKGIWANRLPENKPWKFTDYMNDTEIDVQPAIVHAMRSKDALIKMVKPDHVAKIKNEINKVEVVSETKDFFIGHQMLGDAVGFVAAAHLYSHKIGKEVRIWYDGSIGNRKDIVKWFDGVKLINKSELKNAVDCGLNPSGKEWDTTNGVKRFYKFMDPSLSPKKSFDIHLNKERVINDNKLIGLITHSNTQGDIEETVLKKMIQDAKEQYPKHKILLIGHSDNTVLPEGVEDYRQKTADVNWLFDTISKLDLLITPQTGPCFIAAGFRIPMWVYRSNHIHWDNILNYENYKVQRWYKRTNLTDKEKIEMIKQIAKEKGLEDILNIL
jgi:hypothetical protein